MQNPEPLSGRLMSIDALRGYDMMFIMGVQRVIIALCVWLGFGSDCWAAEQMRHVVWHGWHMMDGVFPVFMFISGLSWPFSYAKQRERGTPTRAILLRIAKRVLVLFLLGLVCEGALHFDRGWNAIRIGSVFFRIGICWAAAAVMAMFWGARTRLLVAIGLLVGYWLLIGHVVAPDAADLVIPKGLEEFGRGPYSVVGCLSGYVDRHILIGRIAYSGILDTQGTLSTFPAIAFPVFGTLAGEFVRLRREGLEGGRKSLIMLGVGFAMIGIGLLWSRIMPFNRSIWTSSHVVFSSGYALSLFAVFYWMIDVKMWRRWTFFFRVIGMNSLLIFLLQRFGGTNLMSAPTHALFDGVVALLPKDLGSVVFALGYTAVCWTLLYFLYRKNVFLRA